MDVLDAVLSTNFLLVSTAFVIVVVQFRGECQLVADDEGYGVDQAFAVQVWLEEHCLIGSHIVVFCLSWRWHRVGRDHHHKTEGLELRLVR